MILAPATTTKHKLDCRLKVAVVVVAMSVFLLVLLESWQFI